jgi:hypothetical protein
MNRLFCGKFLVFLCTSALGIPALAAAQRAQSKSQPKAANDPRAYSLARETVLQGTVVSFTPASQTPPMGAHVVVQTSSGNVDVHLGNPGLLKQSGISLAPGDSVHIVGENIPYGSGSIFAARLLSKGTLSVILRNTNGIPLRSGQVPATSTVRIRRHAGAQ